MKALFTEGQRNDLYEAKARAFGSAFGLSVSKHPSPYPEVLPGPLARLKPSTVYVVRTPKPHDTLLGYVAKKGKRWYASSPPQHVAHSARSAVQALRMVVEQHIRGVMDAVKGAPSHWGNTTDDAMRNLGCHILQGLAKDWGLTEGVLYEAATLMHVVDYVRMEGPGSAVHFWLVKRGDLYYVLKLERTASIGIGVEGAGDLKKCRRIFDLEVENALKGTVLHDTEREIVTRKLDAEGAKRLRTFDSPIAGINWAHMPGETTASDQFVQALRKQVEDWKRTSNPLNITRHREWPAFHAQVVKAVKAKYGDPVTLYRGVWGGMARKVLDGGPLIMRPYTSWTPEISAARQYKGRGDNAWAVIKARFKPESIALAPVHLPDFEDPNILEPLAHDVQHVGDEVVVQWRRKSLPRNRFTLAAKTKKTYTESAGRPPAEVMRPAAFPLGPPDDRMTSLVVPRKSTLQWGSGVKARFLPLSDFDDVSPGNVLRHGLDAMKDRLLRVGFDARPGERIHVHVDQHGVPRIIEGNHRIQAARELRKEGRLKSTTPVPTTVFYLGGSDDNAQAWVPRSMR